LENAISDLENRVSELEGDAGGPVLEGLVLWLPMDEGEGSVVNDKSRFGNHGTIFGAQWVSLNDTYALSFDGTDDTIYTSSPSFIDDTQGTVEIWVQFTDLTQSHCPISISVDGGQDDELLFMYYRGSDDDEKIHIYFAIDGVSSWVAATAADAITDTGWHHWVVTSDGSTVRAYLDTIEKTLTTSKGTNSGQWMASATDADVFTVGALRRATPVIDTKGNIGEVRVYNRALTPQEIQYNYLATK